MLLLNYLHWTLFLFSPNFLPVCMGLWYHHLVNLMNTSIPPASLPSSYISLPVMYFAILTCRLHMYSLVGQSPVTFSTTSTKAHSHSPPSPLCAVIPTIHLVIL